MGKVLKTDFKLYQELISKSNANINIFLDNDAAEDVKKIYKTLNHNRLYNKIRWIPVGNDLDPSKIFELYGYKGIVEHLKKAENHLEYCDSISSFVYGLIVRNLSTTDTLLALKYATKALEKDLEYNNLRRLPYSYLDKSLLSKEDSAQFYLHKSLELFNDWGDKVAKCQYAKWHSDKMVPDSIIAYMLPCYDSIKFKGHASILAEAYLKKGDIDNSQRFVDKLFTEKGSKTDFYYRNSQLLTLKGDYKEACIYWRKSFKLLLEESKFMLNQRLGAINAEYDLLNAELQNEKKRVKIMITYNIVLLVLLVLLSATCVILRRYKHDNEIKEIDIAI